MILRRFMQHVKEQNWFAVGLDVIVVIVGIFLGLQVQAWYEARAERELEQFYLYQLHGEIEEAEPYAISSIEQINLVNETLEQILVIYLENSSFEPFTELQCNAMIRSHVIANFIAPLTTIDEIEQTGRSLIIQNNSLRSLMANYKSAK